MFYEEPQISTIDFNDIEGRYTMTLVFKPTRLGKFFGAKEYREKYKGAGCVWWDNNGYRCDDKKSNTLFELWVNNPYPKNRSIYV
jgi:hypothetical protein